MSDRDIYNSRQPDSTEESGVFWFKVLSGTGLTVLGVQLLFFGPLSGRMDQLESLLNSSGRDIHRLVAERDTAGKANNLLADLQQQSNDLRSVQQGLSRIRTLRENITHEAQNSEQALQSLQQITEVQQSLLAAQSQTTLAADEVSRLNALREEIISGTSSTEVAQSSLDGIVALQNRLIAASGNYEAASDSIAALSDLRDQAINAGGSVAEAAEQFDQFLAFRDRVAETSQQIDAAEESLRQLAALRQHAIDAGSMIKTADQNLQAMLDMNQSLQQRTEAVRMAQQNLDGLNSIQQDLATATKEVSTAIQNLEILEEFQGEAGRHIASLETLRRTLIEIAMMETALKRVSSVMQPLTHISSLRRLGDDEIREAARVILQRRVDSRVAEDSAVATFESVTATSEDDLLQTASESAVPLPVEISVE